MEFNSNTSNIDEFTGQKIDQVIHNQIQIVESDNSIKERNSYFTNNNIEYCPTDYIIPIKRTKFLGIPYFKFGSTIYFYFCICSIRKIEYKLSEIPHPYFSLGPECKKIYFIFY